MKDLEFNDPAFVLKAFQYRVHGLFIEPIVALEQREDIQEGALFGSALLVAMARGVPVVASAVGGIPEIVEHGRTGLLVENQPEDVAAMVLSVLTLPQYVDVARFDILPTHQATATGAARSRAITRGERVGTAARVCGLVVGDGARFGGRVVGRVSDVAAVTGRGHDDDPCGDGPPHGSFAEGGLPGNSVVCAQYHQRPHRDEDRDLP